jgi:Domain of unknown function (DUF1911)
MAAGPAEGFPVDPARDGSQRSHQAGVRPATLDQEIADFDELPAESRTYRTALRWWTARYSRGHGLADLRPAFGRVTDQVQRDGEGDGALVFRYGDGWVGRYRDALVLLSIALCLRLPQPAATVLRWCERGDVLVERLATALGAPMAQAQPRPPFADRFDGLYAAVEASAPADAGAALRDYLRVWLDDRMDDMGFKTYDEGLGYWCFEAAGVVAALDLDDGSFADEPVYPRDLVAFYREGR